MRRGLNEHLKEEDYAQRSPFLSYPGYMPPYVQLVHYPGYMPPYVHCWVYTGLYASLCTPLGILGFKPPYGPRRDLCAEATSSSLNLVETSAQKPPILLLTWLRPLRRSLLSSLNLVETSAQRLPLSPLTWLRPLRRGLLLPFNLVETSAQRPIPSSLTWLRPLRRGLSSYPGTLPGTPPGTPPSYPSRLVSRHVHGHVRGSTADKDHLCTRPDVLFCTSVRLIKEDWEGS